MTMPFPSNVHIEAAGRCNFRCVHCPVGTDGGRRGLLRYADFVHYFDMLPFVPRTLILNHGGEPLLNPDLEYIVHYAKAKGVITVLISTNASLLHVGRNLSEVDELRVSFDGDSPEENDDTRIGSNFEKHSQSVRELALSSRRPATIRIYNVHDSRRAAQYLWNTFGDLPGVELMGEIRREWARVERATVPSNGTTSCASLFNSFTIQADGSVVMCCEDILGEDIVGNVNENTPVEIWDRMEERRAAFAHQDYPRLCRSCWITGRAKQ